MCDEIVNQHKHVVHFVNCLVAHSTMFKAYFRVLFVVNDQSRLGAW